MFHQESLDLSNLLLMEYRSIFFTSPWNQLILFLKGPHYKSANKFHDSFQLQKNQYSL